VVRGDAAGELMSSKDWMTWGVADEASKKERKIEKTWSVDA